MACGRCAEESHFGDFWAEQVPRLQGRLAHRGAPGFAHQSVPVERWKLVVDRADDDTLREVAEPLGPRVQELAGALRNPHREGSWLLSLGVEVEGETLDLAPLLADLLKRDARWLDAREIAASTTRRSCCCARPAGAASRRARRR
jgi:hypothetical protein